MTLVELFAAMCVTTLIAGAVAVANDIRKRIHLLNYKTKFEVLVGSHIVAICAGTRRGDGKILPGLWAFAGDHSSKYWESLAEGLEDTLEKLWPHRELIRSYKLNGTVVWWCGNFQRSFDGGPYLPSSLLEKLSEFGADLYIDNYFSRS